MKPLFLLPKLLLLFLLSLSQSFARHRELIRFATPDGSYAMALEYKAVPASEKYLLIFPQTTQWTHGEAERYARDLPDVNIVVMDMNDVQMAMRKESSRQEQKSKRSRAIIGGILTYAGSEAQIATLGVADGCDRALETTILAGKRSAGCVLYYFNPENYSHRFRMIRVPAVGIFAAESSRQLRDKKPRYRKLKAYYLEADPLTLHLEYPYCTKKDTETAYQLSREFLKKRLR